MATVTHQQLLRAMDALMDRMDEVESALTQLIKPLLDTSRSIVFCDLTTIRIHGEMELPEHVRQYGLNKETGGIAPICVGRSAKRGRHSTVARLRLSKKRCLSS